MTRPSPSTRSGIATQAPGIPADLHLHSNHSDGTERPAEVMRRAHDVGLRTVSLTDHDQISGWEEAATAANSLGMTFLPGMELSVRGAKDTLHLLAYLFDPDNAPLMNEVRRVREDRLTRARRIVSRLTPTYGITWNDVTACTADGVTIGRPHIADALVSAGVVSSRAQAFDDILDVRHDYYEPLYSPSVVTAVRLVVAAGGVPILAHPITGPVDSALSTERIAQLVEAGLAGLEVGHRDNTPDGRQILSAYAHTHDLIVTGSSDYHGDGKPNRLAENTTDEAMVERIIAQGNGATPRYPAVGP